MASGGLRELIPTIARTAVACGVDGLFMEVCVVSGLMILPVRSTVN